MFSKVINDVNKAAPTTTTTAAVKSENNKAHDIPGGGRPWG